MQVQVRYPRTIKWGFKGGDFGGHATGLSIILDEAGQELHVIPLRKDGQPSGSCRISMPLEFLPQLRYILQLEVLRAKDFAERCAG